MEYRNCQLAIICFALWTRIARVVWGCSAGPLLSSLLLLYLAKQLRPSMTFAADLARCGCVCVCVCEANNEESQKLFPHMQLTMRDHAHLPQYSSHANVSTCVCVCVQIHVASAGVNSARVCVYVC